jgi:drug/metabolite transporter (DMT)-like permease
MVIGLGAALLAAVLFGGGAVMQAVAARRGPLVSRLMGLVVLIYVLGWALHLVSIAMVPLYVAQVGIAASLAVTAIAAARVVDEPLSVRHRIAVAVLVGGLALLALSSGPVGTHQFDAAGIVALYAALLGILLIALATLRVGGQRGGLLLGCLGGLAYAGSPIATRSLVEPAWDWLTILPVLSIGLYGLLGFWLYSLALRRGSVIATSGPLVLLQTVVPAIVGVVALDDSFRSGWWPVAVFGFLASTAAALALHDAEARLEPIELHDIAPLTDHQIG